MSLEPQRADRQQEPHGSDPESSCFDGSSNQKMLTVKNTDSDNSIKAYPRQDEQVLWRTDSVFARQIALLAIERQRAQAEHDKPHNELDSESLFMRIILRQRIQDHHLCQMGQNRR